VLGNNLAATHPPQVGEQIAYRYGRLSAEGFAPEKPPLGLAFALR
jgi:hypothetical protein